jgi:hypothetical protein
MLDGEAYRREVLAGVGEIAHLSPDTARGYAALGAAGRSNTVRLEVKSIGVAAMPQSCTSCRTN